MENAAEIEKAKGKRTTTKGRLEKECRYQFQKIYHIVDSQIVHAMIQKNSYGFNTFAATRIGEIQEGTSQTDWYWIESEHNIPDCLTRGKKPTISGSKAHGRKDPNSYDNQKMIGQ